MGFKHRQTILVLFLILTGTLILNANSIPQNNPINQNINKNIANQNIFNTATNNLSQIFSVSIMALTIGFILAGIGYAVGKALSMSQILAWGKEEFYENIYSAVIILSIGLLALVGDLLAAAGNPQSKGLLQDAYERVDAVLEGNAVYDTNGNEIISDGKGLTTILLINMGFQSVILGISRFSDDLLNINAMSIIIEKRNVDGEEKEYFKVGRGHYGGFKVESGPLLGGLEGVASILGQFNSLMLSAIIMTMIHKAVLIFTMSAGPILLGIGVFLRALTFTRRLGSTLIALYLTLQFVYPGILVLLISDQFYGQVVDKFPVIYNDPTAVIKTNVMQQPYITVIQPRSMIYYEDDQDYKLTFMSIVPEYSYTVYLLDGNNKENGDNEEIIAEGKGNNFETTEIDITNQIKSAVDNSRCIDLNSKSFDENNLPLDYFIPYLIEIKWTENDDGTLKEYSYAVAIPVIIGKCDYSDNKQNRNFETARCKSNYGLINSRAQTIIESAYYASAYTDDPGSVWNIKDPGSLWNIKESATAMAVGAAGRIASSIMIKRVVRKTTERVIKEGVEKTTVKLTSKAAIKTAIGAGASLAGATLGGVLAAAPLKGMITSIAYDIVTCDPFTAKVGLTQNNVKLYQLPEGDAVKVSKFEEVTELAEAEVNSALPDEYKEPSTWDAIVNGGADIAKGIYHDTVDAWSASDYESCAMVEAAKSLIGYIPGTTKFVTGFSLPVLYTRIIAVHLITLITLIVSVTLFRSISETLGGDSSLLGMGKIGVR